MKKSGKLLLTLFQGGGVTWVLTDELGGQALFQHDLSNSRWWYNGASYASEAALLTATGGVLASSAYTFNNVVGADTVVNGDFAADANWTKGSLVTISGGVANLGFGGGYLEQSQATVAGKAYRVRCTIAGNIAFTGVWDNTSQQGALSNSAGGVATGTSDKYYKAYDTTSFPAFTASGAGASTIDNVSNVAVEGIPGIDSAVSAAVYARTASAHAAEQCLWASDLNNTSNYIRLSRNTSQELRLIVRDSNVEVANLLLGTVADSTDFGVVFAVTLNDVWGLMEGGTEQTDASAAFPGIAFHRFGKSSAGDAWGGTLYGQAQWNRRVSNAKLTTILAGLAATF